MDLRKVLDVDQGTVLSDIACLYEQSGHGRIPVRGCSKGTRHRTALTARLSQAQTFNGPGICSPGATWRICMRQRCCSPTYDFP